MSVMGGVAWEGEGRDGAVGFGQGWCSWVRVESGRYKPPLFSALVKLLHGK